MLVWPSLLKVTQPICVIIRNELQLIMESPFHQTIVSQTWVAFIMMTHYLQAGPMKCDTHSKRKVVKKRESPFIQVKDSNSKFTRMLISPHRPIRVSGNKMEVQYLGKETIQSDIFDSIPSSSVPRQNIWSTLTKHIL